MINTDRFLLVFLIFVAVLFSCNTRHDTDNVFDLPQTTRVWIGPEFWANPLQDWQLNNGKIECVGSGGLRKIFLLTKEIDSVTGEFDIELVAEKLNPHDTLTEGWIGFEIGIKGEFDDYRSAAIRGKGFPVGINTNGMLIIGQTDTGSSAVFGGEIPVRLRLNLHCSPQSNGKYEISLSVTSVDRSDNSGSSTHTISRKNIPADWIEGGIAIMCHSGKLIEYPNHPFPKEYSVWGYDPRTKRGGNVNFAFYNLKLNGNKIANYSDRAFGPVLFTQYTLSNGTLKLTAQMPPVGKDDSQFVTFDIKKAGAWTNVAKTRMDSLSRTATFRIEDWDSRQDVNYRVGYRLFSSGNKFKDYYYEGVIRKEPIDKDELVLAAFTGNNDLGFPNNDLVSHVKYHTPDILFFSGDQIYEGVGGYGTQREPLDKACLDYLRKWFLFGWAYADLLRSCPSIIIPDDHDVYHGNIWGAGGIATPAGLKGAAAQDMGGYKMPPQWVNMVQRTQTSHLPDPYDSTPVAQGIHVYYTALNYAGVSFAIIEDRKFKSAPKPLLPQADIINGWAQNVAFDPKKSDVEGAVLLGKRQLDFLENWIEDWTNNTWMKVVLSQTIFSNVATLPVEECHSDAIVPKLRILERGDYPPDDVPVADFDSDGWPQSGRNKALRIMRKGFALHIAGDQHLGSTIEYGIEQWRDAGVAFCVPAISNVWPRRWYPSNGGLNRKKGSPMYTGDFYDGFGNKMTVFAVSNPVYTGVEPSVLYDRATGYGIVKFNRKKRKITIECWPRQADPATDKQYEGWPLIFDQQDNFVNNAKWYLPIVSVIGEKNPVIEVINEGTNDVVSILRINGNQYQPKVLEDNFYTIRVFYPELNKSKIIEHIRSLSENDSIIKIEIK